MKNDPNNIDIEPTQYDIAPSTPLQEICYELDQMLEMPYSDTKLEKAKELNCRLKVMAEGIIE